MKTDEAFMIVGGISVTKTDVGGLCKVIYSHMSETDQELTGANKRKRGPQPSKEVDVPEEDAEEEDQAKIYEAVVAVCNPARHHYIKESS